VLCADDVETCNLLATSVPPAAVLDPLYIPLATDP
jgi:hypothetical protein